MSMAGIVIMLSIVVFLNSLQIGKLQDRIRKLESGDIDEN